MIIPAKRAIVEPDLFKFCISDNERIALNAIIEHGTARAGSAALGKNNGYC